MYEALRVLGGMLKSQSPLKTGTFKRSNSLISWHRNMVAVAIPFENGDVQTRRLYGGQKKLLTSQSPLKTGTFKQNRRLRKFFLGWIVAIPFENGDVQTVSIIKKKIKNNHRSQSPLKTGTFKLKRGEFVAYQEYSRRNPL